MKVVLGKDGKVDAAFSVPRTEVMVTDSKCCPLGTLCEAGGVRCQLIIAAPGEGLCPCDDTLPNNCPLSKGPVLIRKVR